MQLRRTVGLTVLAALLAAGVCLAQTMKAGRYEVAALGTRGHWTGFALRDGAGVLAEVKFAARGRWTAGECSITNGGRGLVFRRFDTAGTGGTPTLGAESSVAVTFPAGADFPKVAYRMVVAGFDEKRWRAAFEQPAPLYFLCLSLREPLEWFMGGFGMTTPRVDPYPLNPKAPNGLGGHWAPGWSYAPPLGAFDTPMVGLWNPYARQGLFVGYDFTEARLSDKTEGSTATAYCQGLGGHEECVAVVHPYQRNFVELAYPERPSGSQEGSVAAGHFDLICWTDLGPEGEPQERLLQRTCERYKSLLPAVPSMNDLDWVTDGGIHRSGGTGLIWEFKETTGGPADGYLKVPTTLIGNWDVADGLRAAWERGDTAAIDHCKADVQRLLPMAKHFREHGLDCVAWESPLEGSFLDVWGGTAAATVRHNSTFEIGTALIMLYAHDKDASLLPYIDGVYNWAQRYLETRGNIFDLPAATLPLIATSAGELFLMEYRKAFRGDAQRGEKAERALEMARAAVYKDARFYLGDPDPSGWVDPSFMMQANNGQWWVGKVSWAELGLCLRSMIVLYTETGDPVLEYLLRGAIDRWWLGYRKLGDIDEENIQVVPITGEPEGNRTGGMMGQDLINGFLRYARPTDGAACRVVVGEKAAMAFCAGTTGVNVADYGFKAPASLRFRLINTTGHAVDIIVTAPKRKIGGQAVYVNGVKLPDIRLREYAQTGGEDILVRGLNDGDVVRIGATEPPRAAPLPQPRFRTRPAAGVIRHGDFAGGSSILTVNLYPLCDLALDQQWHGDWFRFIPGGWSVYGATFDLVDAAINGGKCAVDCRQARQIPIHAKGDALYLLCGLTKAERDDMLAAGKSEVGQVEIAYADGTKQSAALTLGLDGHSLNGLPIKRFSADMTAVPTRDGEIDHVTVTGPRLLAVTLASGDGAKAVVAKLKQRNEEQVRAEATAIVEAREFEALMATWKAEVKQGAGGRAPWVAMLPPMDGPMGARVREACTQLGIATVPMSRERFLQEGVDPAVFPVAVYTGAETYVNDPADPERAKQRYLDYLRKGGFLISACTAAPFAFPLKQTDAGLWVPDRESVFKATELHLFGEDMELYVAHPAKTWPDCAPFERPDKPEDLTLKLNPNQQVIASTPKTIAWADRGNADERYRPISGAALAEGDKFTPVYSLCDAERRHDKSGKDYGAAVALIEHGCKAFAGARTMYLWSGLADSDRTQARTLMADALRYSVLHSKWPEGQPKLADFWEDFSGGLDQWQIVAGKKAELRDGALLLGDNTEILSRRNDFGDFEMSLYMSKEGDRYTEVFFRVSPRAGSQDINNAYMFGLRAGNTEVGLFRRQGGTWTQIGHREVWHSAQTWYQVTIRAVGPVIECYVNGQRCIRVEDPTFKAGAIGLGGWENDAMFDDVMINALTR